jgi:excisionase family DNA binding protein
MLMHEWRQYRDRQVRKAVRQAKDAQEQDAAAPPDAAPARPVPEAPVAVPELKSEPDRPKLVLDRLTAGNEDLRERLAGLHARQQMLPLDVQETLAPPAQGGRAAESREELVQRLLDPVLSLEEAAVLLDVCPTTVRRYTNRGILKCYRTPGNQRRFRLSEIVSFMERRQMPKED